MPNNKGANYYYTIEVKPISNRNERMTLRIRAQRPSTALYKAMKKLCSEQIEVKDIRLKGEPVPVNRQTLARELKAKRPKISKDKRFKDVYIKSNDEDLRIYDE